MLRVTLDIARRWQRVFDIGSIPYHAGREIVHLLTCVQTHHDQRGDNRCYLDDLKLYHDALGTDSDPYVTALPPDPDMEVSCRRYRDQRQHPEVHGQYPMPDGMTIQQLTDEVIRLRGELAAVRQENVTLKVDRDSLNEALEITRTDGYNPFWEDPES